MALKRLHQRIFTLLCILCVYGLSAQQQPTYFQQHQAALGYYDLGQWGMAAQLWEELLSLEPGYHAPERLDTERYYLQARLLQGQKGAQLALDQWLIEHPSAPGVSEANLVLADHAFSKGNYTESAARYQQLGTDVLHRPDNLKHVYQQGFSLVALEDFTAAQASWQYLADRETWKDAARFYLGYIAYRTDLWDDALNFWGDSFADSAYNERADYLKADLFFRKKEYNLAIDLSKRLYPQVSTAQQASLDHILGQCYFELGSYKESISYLSKTVTQEHNTPYRSVQVGGMLLPRPTLMNKRLKC